MEETRRNDYERVYVPRTARFFREGSDIPPHFHLIHCSISIHAPAKGATDYFFIQLAQSKISIHAPAKGATACSAAACGADCHFNPRSREGSDSTTASRRSRDSHFNPRSREGSDPAPPRCRHLHHSISIHAPAKGATQDIVCLWITL